MPKKSRRPGYVRVEAVVDLGDGELMRCSLAAVDDVPDGFVRETVWSGEARIVLEVVGYKRKGRG